MQSINVSNANIHIKESTYIFDTGEEENVEIFVEEGLTVRYCLIPGFEKTLTRTLHFASGVDFVGSVVVLSKGLSLDITTAVEGDSVTSHLSLLGLAVDDSNISLSSVARVDKPYRHIVTRVDQTNILIGESARIRGIPKLEIATDDVEGGHSCKIHRLGGEALFYLQARGIDAYQGEALLLNSEILRHLSTLSPEQKEEQCHALHKKLENFRSIT